MAGFFGLFDYNKEGPGVYLNEPPKGPFKTFFTVLGRKFWKIITVNIMYCIFSLPVIVLAVLIGMYVFPSVLPFLQLENFEKLLAPLTSSQISQTVSQTVSQAVSQVAVSGKDTTVVLSPKEAAAALFLLITVTMSMALIGLQLIVLGPVQAGVTYIFRNYSREEHAFIWGDFKDHMRKNWKQSAVTSLIGIVAFMIISVNISFYSGNLVASNNILNGILTGMVFILLLIFSMMQMYIYPMMVTFKFTVRQLYKNALLLTLARLPFNIGILLLTLIVTFVIPFMFIFFLSTIGIFACIVYYLFIGFGLNLLITNFYVYRQMKKYLIDPILQKEQEEKEAQGLIDEKEKAIFSDIEQERDEK